MIDCLRILIGQRPVRQEWPILAILNEQADVKIVGEVTDHVELLLAVRNTDANVVLIQDIEENEGMLSHLFTEYPDLVVLAVRGSESVFIEQRCRVRMPVYDCTAEGVVHSLRSAVQHSCDVAIRCRH